MQNVIVGETAKQMAKLAAREPQENYSRLNLNRFSQAQLPQGFCNLLTQPLWN